MNRHGIPAQWHIVNDEDWLEVEAESRAERFGLIDGHGLVCPRGCAVADAAVAFACLLGLLLYGVWAGLRTRPGAVALGLCGAALVTGWVAR